MSPPKRMAHRPRTLRPGRRWQRSVGPTTKPCQCPRRHRCPTHAEHPTPKLRGIIDHRPSESNLCPNSVGSQHVLGCSV
eukprot:970529-Pyramimonas_sp.AAC.1